MKRTILVVAIALMASVTSFAQSVVKIGYTNAEYILSKLPEAKRIETQVKDHEAQLVKQLQSKQETIQRKMQEYQQTAQTMIETVRKDKEREITTLQQDGQQFQVKAQESIQKKVAELLQPVYIKINKAIKEVAEKEGYSHIFSNDAGGGQVILYADPKTDISELVLKHLGISVEKSAAK